MSYSALTISSLCALTYGPAPGIRLYKVQSMSQYAGPGLSPNLMTTCPWGWGGATRVFHAVNV